MGDKQHFEGVDRLKMGGQMTHCCGFKLKQGTIIIGVVQSIIAFMFLVLSAAYAENPHELIDMSDPGMIPSSKILRALLVVIAVGSALQCVFSILLIFAAETNRPLLLMPWLIHSALGLALYVLITVIALTHSNSASVVFIVGHLLFAILTIFLVNYQIFAVWNFYKHLKSLNF